MLLHQVDLLQSKARKVVEQGWGLLVSRFAIWSRSSLWKGKDWDQRMSIAVIASIILHNICVERKDPPWPEQFPQAQVFDTDDFVAPPVAQEATTLRHQMAMHIYSIWTINADGHAVRR